MSPRFSPGGYFSAAKISPGCFPESRKDPRREAILDGQNKGAILTGILPIFRGWKQNSLRDSFARFISSRQNLSQTVSNLFGDIDRLLNKGKFYQCFRALRVVRYSLTNYNLDTAVLINAT